MIGHVIMYNQYFKRYFDFTLAALLLLALVPVFVILLIGVKLDTRGPFLFCQKRVGRGLKEFTIYKIRTMSKESGDDANDPLTPYIKTQKNDPRVTRFGKYLRSTHLDELPQLFNVLIGEMSFVGVRPDAPSQVSEYQYDTWLRRHSCRPGITGLSQVHSADANFNASRRRKYDIMYVYSENKFSLDLYILIKTFIKLFRGNSN